MAHQLMIVGFVALLIVWSKAAPASKKLDILPFLENYVNWMERTSQQFDQADIRHDTINDSETAGYQVHKLLMPAVTQKLQELEPRMDTKKLSELVFFVLENELLASNLTMKEIVGLVFADSVTASRGARLAVASRVFAQLTARLRRLLEENRLQNMDADSLFHIDAIASAAEIAFDTMVSSFYYVEKLVEEAANETTADDRSRVKRQTNNVNLGGGFSVGNNGLTYTRDQTSVTAKPHFSLQPKISYEGVTLGAEYRFNNNRMSGSVFGSATIDGQSRLNSAKFGARLQY